jgi:hypothetical protein
MLDDIPDTASDRALQGLAQVVDLLDQMLQVEICVTAGAQKIGLCLRPGVEVLLVELLSGRLDPRRHIRSEIRQLG